MEIKLEILMLGLIQGLTEWLPISSSGHLRVLEILFGLKPLPLFEIILHVATLIVTLLYFRAEVYKILVALIRLNFKSEEGALILRLLTGLVLSATVGALTIIFIDDIFYRIAPLGAAFLFSGSLIYASKGGKCVKEYVDYKSAAIIGAMQGLSIIPGLSRSGLTISVALMLGIKREVAFKFSFLLSIPAIIGALILMILFQADLPINGSLELTNIFASCLIAGVVGYFSLKFLYRFLQRFHLFSLYLLPLGLLLILADTLLR